MSHGEPTTQLSLDGIEEAPDQSNESFPETTEYEMAVPMNTGQQPLLLENE